ncbi:MAG: hypothetical protein AAGE43_17270 [Pseudomonadota bacterium]
MRVAIALLILTCGGVAYAGPSWQETTGNCDGTEIEGAVSYTVHYGRESRASAFLPTNTNDPCAAPGPEDFSYSEKPLPISVGQDLCEVLAADGVWYVAMTAKTAEGESAHSNEKIVLVHKADKTAPCRSL